MEARREVSIANFNIHAGIDGWGRPFDVVGACRKIDADVLVIEESWANDGEPSCARRVAEALGYEHVEYALASGRRVLPDPAADGRWAPRWERVIHHEALFLDSELPYAKHVIQQPRFASADPGSWGLAVLSRLPVVDTATIQLGRLWRDRARRLAVVLRVDVHGRPLTVVGTHMSHILSGSPVQLVRLAKYLRRQPPDERIVLVGDMNMWGRPLAMFFPGWDRTVRGASWPAWRPHSQLDHILMKGALRFRVGEVLANSGSDHRAVRATLALE
jgi:endonuclease/exonuclease/phosphatase family metal-dependent hydrolase